MIFCNKKANTGIGILKTVQLEADAGKTMAMALAGASGRRRGGFCPKALWSPTRAACARLSGDGRRHAMVLLVVSFLRTESVASSWQFDRHSIFDT